MVNRYLPDSMLTRYACVSSNIYNNRVLVDSPWLWNQTLDRTRRSLVLKRVTLSDKTIKILRSQLGIGIILLISIRMWKIRERF